MTESGTQRPLEGARVLALEDPPVELVRTDASGRFVLSRFPPLAALACEHEGYETATLPAAALPAHGGTIELRLHALGAIQGCVRGRSGELLPGVELIVHDLRRGDHAPLPGAAARTDASGGFRVEGLPCGAPLLVRATSGSHAPSTLEVLVDPEDRCARVELTLEEGAVLLGRVVRSDGSAAPGERVLLALAGRGSDDRRRAVSGEAGRIAFGGLSPGMATLRPELPLARSPEDSSSCSKCAWSPEPRWSSLQGRVAHSPSPLFRAGSCCAPCMGTSGPSSARTSSSLPRATSA